MVTWITIWLNLKINHRLLSKFFSFMIVSNQQRVDGSGGGRVVELPDDYFEDVEMEPVKRQLRLTFKERDQGVPMIGYESRQLDASVNDMISRMNPTDQQSASKMITEAAKEIRQAVDSITAPIKEPPLEIFIKTGDGKNVALTSQNVLSLRKDGKYLNPVFFDDLSKAVDTYNTSEENKQGTKEWCKIMQAFYVMKINLIKHTEECIKYESESIKSVVNRDMSVILSEQKSMFAGVTQEFSNFINWCNSNTSMTVQALGVLEGSLTGVSNSLHEGVMTLANQHAASNQKLTNIEGALQTLGQNNLSQQLQLYKGLESNFGALSNQQLALRKDISATNEQLNGIAKQIELLKNDESTLAQEQTNQVGALVTKMSGMTQAIKDIVKSQEENRTLNQQVIDYLTAIITMNESIEGIKTQTFEERNYLVAVSGMLQRLCTVVPEIKDVVESIQDASTKYGKEILDRQQMIAEAQIASINKVSDALVLFERSTADRQKVQEEWHQETLKAIQDAASKQDIKELQLLVKNHAANELQMRFNVEDVTKIIMDILKNGFSQYGDQMVSMVQGLIEGRSAPLALPPGTVPPQLPPGNAPLQLPPGGGALALLPPEINFDASAPSFKPGKSRGVQKKTKPAKKKSYYNVRITGPDGKEIEDPLTNEAKEVEKDLPAVVVGREQDEGDLELVPQGSRALSTKTKTKFSKRNLNWANRSLVVRRVGEVVLGKQKTAALMNALVMRGSAMIGSALSSKAARAVLAMVPHITGASSGVMNILSAVRIVGGLLARYIGLFNRRSAENNQQLVRQGDLIENAINRLMELREARDGDRFNLAPAVMTQLMDQVGTVQTITIPTVMHYGKMERMTPAERVRTVMSLAGRSSSISTRSHGIVVLKKNITDPALDNAADYKRATAKRRATRVKKIEQRRTNDPLNKFFQGNW